jgi:hypothetical protein
MEKEKQVRSLKKSVKGSSSKNRVLYKEGKSGVKPTHSSVKFANTESMKKTGVRFVPTESKYDFTVKEASFGSKKIVVVPLNEMEKKSFFHKNLVSRRRMFPMLIWSSCLKNLRRY